MKPTPRDQTDLKVLERVEQQLKEAMSTLALSTMTRHAAYVVFVCDAVWYTVV